MPSTPQGILTIAFQQITQTIDTTILVCLRFQLSICGLFLRLSCCRKMRGLDISTISFMVFIVVPSNVLFDGVQGHTCIVMSVRVSV
jgi:hypothetical protein